MWQKDPVFQGNEQKHPLSQQATPCFRLSAYFPFRAGHPYTHTEAFEELFACVAPILKERCDKILMWDKPGAKASKVQKIKDEYWQPFKHMRGVHADVEDGVFLGFHFRDREEEKETPGGKACGFKYFVWGNATTLDICIPLDDWSAGKINIDAVITALQKIPYYGFLTGYGLSLSNSFENPAADWKTREHLPPIAKKYPALDIAYDKDRYYLNENMDADGLKVRGVPGINWITGVGNMFVSAYGGKEKICSGLPKDIAIDEGKYGLVFRLGEKPITGEAKKDDSTLPLYHALGKNIRPAKTDKYARYPVFGEGTEKDSAQWARRFHV